MRISEAQASEIVRAFELLAVVLDDPAVVAPVLRDPSDDYLIALARAADAEAIVTGDRDLLDHVDLLPPAITPRAACEMLGIVA